MQPLLQFTDWRNVLITELQPPNNGYRRKHTEALTFVQGFHANRALYC